MREDLEELTCTLDASFESKFDSKFDSGEDFNRALEIVRPNTGKFTLDISHTRFKLHQEVFFVNFDSCQFFFVSLTGYHKQSLDDPQYFGDNNYDDYRDDAEDNNRRVGQQVRLQFS